MKATGKVLWKIKAIVAMLTITAMLLANHTIVYAGIFPDIADGTYTLSASLSCYVPAMGGIEFGGPLLKNVKVTVSGNEAVMTVNLKKSQVTIYGVTCDTFISANTGTLGYYTKSGSLKTDLSKTISSDTVKDGANNDVNYVTSISFPLDQETSTYKLALYVDSNVMGTQFGADGNYDAKLTVDWSSVPRNNTQEESEKPEKNESNNGGSGSSSSNSGTSNNNGSSSSNNGASNNNGNSSSNSGTSNNNGSSSSNSGTSNNKGSGSSNSSTSNKNGNGNSSSNSSTSNNNGTGSSSSNSSTSNKNGNTTTYSNNNSSNSDSAGNNVSENETVSSFENTETQEIVSNTELVTETEETQTDTTEEVVEKDGLNIHYAGTEFEEDTEELTTAQNDANGGIVTGVVIAIAATGGIAGYIISKKKKG